MAIKVNALLITIKHFLVLMIVLHVSHMTGSTDDYPEVNWKRVDDAIAKSKANFRRTQWGMTIEQVKASETGRDWSFINQRSERDELNRDKIFLNYEGKMLGYRCFLMYTFILKSLYSASYSIISSENKGIHSIIEKQLTAKYGKPIDDGWWRSKDEKTNIGLNRARQMVVIIYISREALTKESEEMIKSLNPDDL